MRIFTIAFSILLLTNCRSMYLARDLPFFALSPDTRPGHQVGIVKGYNCGLRVLGFGPSAKLPKALDMLRKDQKIRYLTRVRVYRRFRNWALVDRDCWIVRGIAYK